MPDDFSPSLDNLARRQSGTQQWQTAIEQQRQRALVRPSMGEQLGDVVNRIIAGNPLMQMAQLYQDIYEGRVDPTSPQAAGRSLWSAVSMAGSGMPYAQRGALGAGGGKPFWENLGVKPSSAGLPTNLSRYSVLTKLIASGDFQPNLVEGKRWFKVLSPAENEVMNRIGWSRADNVTFADETSSSPEVRARAWEQNIRHWLRLSSPPGDWS